MALYLGNQQITTINSEFRSWWALGKNPKLLYEATFEANLLNDTDYNTMTPSNNQQGAKYLIANKPFADYNSAPATFITYDRWGEGYHNGERLDFAKNDYFILTDILIKVAYTQYNNADIPSGTPHVLGYTGSYIYGPYTAYSINSTNTGANLGTNTANILLTNQGTYRIWYITNQNKLASAAATYGLYGGLVAPTFSTTPKRNDSTAYMNFRTPYFYFRNNSTYHASAAFDYIDIANSWIKVRQKLYKTELISKGYFNELINRQAYLYNHIDDTSENNHFICFPVE